jgi:cytidine deaminase
MSFDKRMLDLAAEVAVDDRSSLDNRTFFLGAVGERRDGVLVTARNIAATDIAPSHHAEARVVRKLTPHSTVWVARVAKGTGEWAMSRPCGGCQRRMKASGVKRVVYTINPDEWGVIQF